MDEPLPEEERKVVWQTFPQISPNPILCEINPLESLSKRRMLEANPIATSIMGNRHCTKLIQVFKPTMVFNLLSFARVLEWGVVEHCVTLILGKGQTFRMLKKIGWNLRKEAELLLSYDECPTPYHQLAMNIIAWTCRGALKPTFQGHIHDLVQNHDSTIMIAMETRLGDSKAKEIIDRLLFDGALHTGTIGYARGLWLLWNSDRVEVEALANTEQEIHVEVKVRSSNFAWLLSTIYASPRSKERCISWENLTKVAELHRMPCVRDLDKKASLKKEIRVPFKEPLFLGKWYGVATYFFNKK